MSEQELGYLSAKAKFTGIIAVVQWLPDLCTPQSRWFQKGFVRCSVGKVHFGKSEDLSSACRTCIMERAH